MSFKLVAIAFDIKVGNPLRKMVLLKLADQANDDGECYPSYESIAKACEISRRSVITHIQWLEDNGFLRIEKRFNAKENKNFSNRYYLNLNKSQKTNGETPAQPSENPALSGELNALGSANNTLGSETPALSNGETPAPKPIIKPINESIKEAESEKNTHTENSKISDVVKNPTQENLTPQETFEFLKSSLAFGSEFGIISQRNPNLAEINVKIVEEDCYWTERLGYKLDKQALLGKILGSVSRLGASERIERYTLPQATADAPVIQHTVKSVSPFENLIKRGA